MNKIIGRFIPNGVSGTPFNVLTKIPSDYMSPSWEGIKEDGQEYHVVARAWTFEQYEATGWDGTGLPPVGCECEWQDKNTKQWQPVKVVYASEWVTVIREINEEKGDDLVEIAIENYGDDTRLKFRPLRTEAERAIDEMVQLSGVSIGAAKILYDAGYRK